MRTQLGTDLAWTSELVGGEQVFRYVDAAPGVDAPLPGLRTEPERAALVGIGVPLLQGFLVGRPGRP